MVTAMVTVMAMVPMGMPILIKAIQVYGKKYAGL
jgi:hypothetical protein